jgi:hypothetical protein
VGLGRVASACCCRARADQCSAMVVAHRSPCECGKCKDCDGDRRCQTCANCARCLLCGPARPTGVWHNGIKWLKSNVDGVERAVRNKWAVYVNGLGCGFLQSADNELGILDLLIEQKSLGNLSKASVQAVRFKYMVLHCRAQPTATHNTNCHRSTCTLTCRWAGSRQVDHRTPECAWSAQSRGQWQGADGFRHEWRDDRTYSGHV